MNGISFRNDTPQTRKFCDSPFWDSHMFWDSSFPQFSSCFCDTLLPSVPLLVLLMTSVYDFYYVRKKWRNNSPPVLWNWTICVIMPVILIMMIISVIELFRSLLHNEHSIISPIFSSVIKVLSLSFAMIFAYIYQRKDLRISVSLPLFWLSNIIASVINFYTISERGNANDFDISLNVIAISISIIGIIVTCIPNFNHSSYDELIEDDNEQLDYCPVKNINLFSRMTYFWVFKLLFLGFRVTLDNQQHFKPLCFYMRSANSSDKFNRHYHNYNLNRVKTRIAPVIFLTSWITFLIALSLDIIAAILTLAQPILIGKLLDFIQSEQSIKWHGMLYAIGYSLSSISARTINAQSDTLLELTSIRIKSAMISAIYAKILRLSPSARRKYTAGEMTNLMGVDTQEVLNSIGIINVMVIVPLKITIAIYILWTFIGASAFALFGVMIVIAPITTWIMHKCDHMWTEHMQLKDKRMEQLSEIFNNIKLLKLFAWEKPFIERVTETRLKEVKKLLHINYWSSGIDVIWSMSPMIIAAVCFSVFILSGAGVFDARVAFVSLSVFNIMRPSMAVLPMVLVKFMRANVSSKRIREFLDAEEVQINPNRIINPHKYDDDYGSITIDGTFTWDAAEPPVLKDITINVKKGSLIAIVGHVGCGKSSLFSAIMGEIYQTKGDAIKMSGSLAYVPQTAWIQNSTIKKNIVFMSSYEEEKYNKIVSACSLEPDFEILPARDETEIGEKGVNLSGGQKHRVSLARAVYHDADIYLLDDPLSAVDAHVAHHLFQQIIGPDGLLSQKTRLLATHHVSFLKDVDMIIVMKNGEIIGRGTYEQLLANGLLTEEVLKKNDNDIEETPIESDNITSISRQLSTQLSTNTMMRQISKLSDMSDTSSVLKRQLSIQSGSSGIKPESTKEAREREAKIGQLIDEELQELGNIKLSDYFAYIKQCGIIFCVLCFATELGFNACEIGANYWLNIWSSKNDHNNTGTTSSENNINLGIFSSAIIAEGIFVVFGNVFVFIGALRASAQMHKDMLVSVLRTPLEFFDVTPIGRILNRFNRDISGIDEDVPLNFKMVLQQYLMFPFVIAMIVMLSPYLLIMLIIISILFYAIYKLYVWTSRHLKRLESITRSPVYAHFTESILGVSSIRAYNAQKQFICESNDRVDVNNNCYWMQWAIQQWLEVWSGFIGAIITFSTSIFIVINRDISTGMAGLVLVYSVMIIDCLDWAVRVSTYLENNMVSVERIREYSRLTAEAEWDSNDNARPNHQWPVTGRIDFDNYSAKYRPELDPVLKNLTISIAGGEKIGIVGRTGAGKSSMTLALFRIIEPITGKIMIDGVDVTKIGLHDLRSKLTIIPQEPSLFSGTLRLNLDPFNEYSDETLWTALEDSHLKEFVNTLENGLEHSIAEGGDNLSSGQRQLVCLTRALLRKSRILVLDEATAACDMETDRLIQTTIREKFSQCTIVTIAHRLNTVMDYDRVLVLSQGKLIESGTPQQLLNNTNSTFYGLAKEAGIVIEKCYNPIATPLEKMIIAEEFNLMNRFENQSQLLKEIIDSVEPNIIITDALYLPALPSVANSGCPWILLDSGNPLRDNLRLPPPNLGLYFTHRTQWSMSRKEYNHLKQSNKKLRNKWMIEEGLSSLPENRIRLESPFINIYNFPKEIDYCNLRSLPSNWKRFDAFVRTE